MGLLTEGECDQLIEWLCKIPNCIDTEVRRQLLIGMPDSLKMQIADHDSPQTHFTSMVNIANESSVERYEGVWPILQLIKRAIVRFGPKSPFGTRLQNMLDEVQSRAEQWEMRSNTFTGLPPQAIEDENIELKPASSEAQSLTTLTTITENEDTLTTSPFKTIGNYKLLELLGEGAFGQVHKAEHQVLKNKIVAIKLFPAMRTKEQREKFADEANTLQNLKHPYILPIIDAGTEGNTPYLVTEFAPGGSLYDRLDQSDAQPLSPDEILRILRQVAEALNVVHKQGIVHRDVKPANILFNASGDVWLVDFGLSTILGNTSIKQITGMGTTLYMSPEQFTMKAGKESDQYALGCIAYELLTGQEPFTAESPAEIMHKHMYEEPQPPNQHNPLLPEHISQAILKAMAKDRHQRFTDVLDFVNAMEGKPLTTQPHSSS